MCPDGTQWAIDPYLVASAQGDWFLAARVDLPGGINTIQLRQLGPGAANFADGSTWSELTRNAPTSWEQPVLENAGVVHLAPPTGTPHYGPWLATDANHGVFGPGPDHAHVLDRDRRWLRAAGLARPRRPLITPSCRPGRS